MSTRFMRMLALFDLPMDTAQRRKNYRKFRTFLITNGFMMLQKSVYCRLILNAKAGESVTANVYKHRPPEGVVMMLSVTERQFANMECVTGDFSPITLATDEFTVYV